MKVEEIKVGRTYSGGPRTRPRTVKRLDYYWTRTYHGLVYYAGRAGQEIECEATAFAKWAQFEVKEQA